MTPSLPDCLTRFEGHGITFEYPDVWELDEEDEGTDTVITVSADDSCFWVVRILPETPRTTDVITSCVEAFQEEYDDVEIEESSGMLADMPAMRRELQFSCHELLNTAVLTCVRTLEMTLLVWWQATDHELSDIRPHFERMVSSLRILSLAN